MVTESEGEGQSEADLGPLAEDEVFDAAAGTADPRAPCWGVLTGQGQRARLRSALGKGR